MFRSLDDFHSLQAEVHWTTETLGHLTDESLAFDEGADIRSLGRLAGHLAQTIPDMSHRLGLRVPGIYGPAKEDWARWGMQPPAI